MILFFTLDQEPRSGERSGKRSGNSDSAVGQGNLFHCQLSHIFRLKSNNSALVGAAGERILY